MLPGLTPGAGGDMTIPKSTRPGDLEADEKYCFELFIDSEERVLGGNGRREGYIFTYVNQPQWDLWTAGMVDS